MVDPLKYGAGLDLQEAQKRYDDVLAEFRGVKSHYSGCFGWLKRKLSEPDIKSLTDCVGVLTEPIFADSIDLIHACSSLYSSSSESISSTLLSTS